MYVYMSCKRYSTETELKVSESNQCKFQCCKHVWWNGCMLVLFAFPGGTSQLSQLFRSAQHSLEGLTIFSSRTCCGNFLYSDIGYGKDTKHFLHPLGVRVLNPPEPPQSDVLHMSTSWQTFGISAPRHRCWPQLPDSVFFSAKATCRFNDTGTPPWYGYLYTEMCLFNGWKILLSVFPKMVVKNGDDWSNPLRKLPTKK